MTPEITKEDFTKLPQDLQEQIVSALSEFNKSDEIIQDNEEELESIKLPEILKNDADILAQFKLPAYLNEDLEYKYSQKELKYYHNKGTIIDYNITRQYGIYYQENDFNNLIKYIKIKSNGKILLEETSFKTNIMGPNRQFILKNTETSEKIKFAFTSSDFPYIKY